VAGFPLPLMCRNDQNKSFFFYFLQKLHSKLQEKQCASLFIPVSAIENSALLAQL
jgi:hypothetical protein